MEKIYNLLMFIVFLSNHAWSHQAPVHEHDKLIPIAPYSPPSIGAGAPASLKVLNEFLDTFQGDLKSFFVFRLNAPERKNWSNLPARFVNRPGLRVGEMTNEQRGLLFKFLSASLGKDGYNAVANVMAAEAFLNGDPRATFMKWNPENYWFAIYGNPASDSPWGWQLGGHHLSLNISVEDNRIISMSPSFIGTEPAVFTHDEIEYKVLVDMHKAGLAVYEALSNKQKQQAILKNVPNDVITGPGRDRVIPPQVGITGNELNNTQKKLLLEAIHKWVSIQPDESATDRMAAIEQQLDNITFAWIGTGQVNSNTYYRIQGPSLIIELLSTEGNAGDSAKGLGHYHTIYRNPTKEYGQKPRR